MTDAIPAACALILGAAAALWVCGPVAEWRPVRAWLDALMGGES